MNDGKYKISVLITFYNQEMYVDQALSSVMSQTTDVPYKIIVGDDGSTDSTVEKLKGWIKEYPDQIEVLVQPRENDRKIYSRMQSFKKQISFIETG